MQESLDVLAGAPAIVRACLRSADLATVALRSSPEEWSMAEIVGHIRAADTIWRTRILTALVHDGVALPGVDERRLQELQDGGGATFDDRVLHWALGREELVGILSALDDAGWDRTCVHSAHGVMTVGAMCTAFATHEAEHLEQLRTGGQ